LISGCCTPPEFILFDKTTGQQKKQLGSLIYYSDNRSFPFVIGFGASPKDGNYDLNVLLLYNTDLNKTFRIDLPKGAIETALKQTEELAPEMLFEERAIKNGRLNLVYRVTNERTADRTKTISIALSKYSS
jgi:hypothetical protein